MTTEELLLHRELELLRAAGRIRKRGHNRQARARTRERSEKYSHALEIMAEEVKKMDKVTAKFKCTEIATTEHYDGTGRLLHTGKFNAVAANSPENKVFFAATPSGQISLGSFLPDIFKVGQEYLVEFTPAEAAKTVTDAQ